MLCLDRKNRKWLVPAVVSGCVQVKLSRKIFVFLGFFPPFQLVLHIQGHGFAKLGEEAL